MKNELNLKMMTHLKLWKHIVFAIIGSLGLMALNLIISTIITAYGHKAYPNIYDYQQFITYSTANMILNVSSYVITFVIFIVLSFNDSEEFFKSFKGWKPYVAAAIGFAAIISFNILYNSILDIAKISVNDNANESTLNTMIVDFPLASILVIAFIGPICEELTYRVGLFTLLSKVQIILAYIATIIIFALIHFDFESIGTDTLINELLNIPFYAFAGFVFCFLYQKFGLASSVAAHVSNNLFSVLATIVTIIR